MIRHAVMVLGISATLLASCASGCGPATPQSGSTAKEAAQEQTDAIFPNDFSEFSEAEELDEPLRTQARKVTDLATESLRLREDDEVRIVFLSEELLFPVIAVAIGNSGDLGGLAGLAFVDVARSAPTPLDGLQEFQRRLETDRLGMYQEVVQTRSTDFFRQLYEDVDPKSAAIIWHVAGRDDYGNDTLIKVASILVTRETAEKINWPSFRPSNWPSVADAYADVF